jgi:outer membrane protein assembly factor BamE (lipoprotein component of BamABCDE complex)
MKSIASALAIALALAGCAGPGAGHDERNSARFAQVRVGMTQDDTLALLGRPDQTMPFPLSGQLAWSYVYWDESGYLVEHSVNFGPDRRVASRTLRRINDGGDQR